MVKKDPDDYTDIELQEIGYRVAQYWDRYGEDEPIPGADLVEEVSRILQEAQ